MGAGVVVVVAWSPSGGFVKDGCGSRYGGGAWEKYSYAETEVGGGIASMVPGHSYNGCEVSKG